MAGMGGWKGMDKHSPLGYRYPLRKRGSISMHNPGGTNWPPVLSLPVRFFLA